MNAAGAVSSGPSLRKITVRSLRTAQAEASSAVNTSRAPTRSAAASSSRASSARCAASSPRSRSRWKSLMTAWIRRSSSIAGHHAGRSCSGVVSTSRITSASTSDRLAS
jgi:hypothetical protein